jgi:hypothetical protein
MHMATKVWARRSIVLLAMAGLGLFADRCQASQLTILDAADGYAESTSGNGTFNLLNTTSSDLVVRQFTNTVIDRSIAKFNLGLLPSHAVITSVSFEFNSVVITGNTGRTVNVLGFNSSSAVSLADATATASALGSYDNYALGLGLHSISLNTATFQSLLNTSDGIALRLQGVETANTAISSYRDVGFQPPTLIVNYTTPEPASIISALLAVVCLGGYCGVCRTRAGRSFA